APSPALAAAAAGRARRFAPRPLALEQGRDRSLSPTPVRGPAITPRRWQGGGGSQDAWEVPLRRGSGVHRLTLTPRPRASAVREEICSKVVTPLLPRD